MNRVAAENQTGLVQLQSVNDSGYANSKKYFKKNPEEFLRSHPELANRGFNLRIQNLFIWVPESKSCLGRGVTKEKAIIKGITSEFRFGTMSAIIGPSGSGKTTIMNFLAGRHNESVRFRTSADYFLNEVPIKDVSYYKNLIGYVLQEDLMETELTPRQTFEFYARLRSHPDPKATAQTIIDDLELARCADTVIGNEFKRGLSGGEKKRVNIGIELVSSPNVLFLDEPTTGLDSITAFEVINVLFKLKRKGMTIITVLHAPSNEILNLFDKTVVLCDGQLVYDGPPDMISQRLAMFNLEIPPFENPIEFFMKTIDKDDTKVQMVNTLGSVDEELVNQIHKTRINNLVQAQKIHTLRQHSQREVKTSEELGGIDLLASIKNQRKNFLSELIYLTSFFAYLFLKDFRGVMMRSILFWAINALIIIIYTSPESTDPATIIQNKSGLLFMLVVLYYYIGANSTTLLFLNRKRIYLKDHQKRMYSPFAFYVANQLYTIPFYLVNMTITLLVVYYGLGLNQDPSTNYLWFLLFYFVVAFMGGGSLNLAISILVDTIQDAGASNPLINLPMVLTGGFLATVKTIIEPLRTFSYISPARYAFQGVILTQFGEDWNNPFFDFYEKQKWKNLVIGASLMLGYRILFFFLFLYRYRERNTNYSFNLELVKLHSPEYYDQYFAKYQQQNKSSISKNPFGGISNRVEAQPNFAQNANLQPVFLSN